jgi:hypothetical protein
MERLADGSITFDKSSVIASETKELPQLLDVLWWIPIGNF